MIIDFSDTGKKITMDFSPRVFMEDKTHSYLLVEPGKNNDLFMRFGNGCIELVKLGKSSTTRLALVPQVYDYYRALEHYLNSQLSKTTRVERILKEQLGISTEGLVVAEDEAEEPKKALKTQNHEYTLQELCTELNMNPTGARKVLRGRIEKPENGWKWTEKADVDLVRAVLTESMV